VAGCSRVWQHSDTTTTNLPLAQQVITLLVNIFLCFDIKTFRQVIANHSTLIPVNVFRRTMV
jgi:hypothetical protein